MACPVVDLCEFLLGSWSIRRRGWGGAPVGSVRLVGTARVVPGEGGLWFEERGTLVAGAYRGEAERRYRFDACAGATADVRFDDGRPFHRLDLSTGVASVVHECGPDRYRGRYRVLGPDRWLLGWRVTGPRKAQVIATLFTRVTPGAAGRASCGRTTA